MSHHLTRRKRYSCTEPEHHGQYDGMDGAILQDGAYENIRMILPQVKLAEQTNQEEIHDR